MALINCPECGSEISSKAKVCPHCGFRKVNKKIKIFRRLVFVLLGGLLLIIIINNFFIIHCQVYGKSMENTFFDGEKIFGNRKAYLFKQPMRGDIIVFKHPDDRSQLGIGRIIGLPGDEVNLINGEVYINDQDEPLEDDFCPDGSVGNFGPYYVPEESYFILGDNRNFSEDSRFWDNTYIKFDDIEGKFYVD